MDIISYRELAERALRIMRIEFLETEQLGILLDRIRYALLLPASSTEVAILTLCTQITDKIQAGAEASEINELLDKLSFEVSFLHWD